MNLEQVAQKLVKPARIAVAGAFAAAVVYNAPTLVEKANKPWADFNACARIPASCSPSQKTALGSTILHQEQAVGGAIAGILVLAALGGGSFSRKKPNAQGAVR